MTATIKSLKPTYFRGFTKEQDIDLSYPVTIIFGGNAVGKSSVLNAIEWCLFGESCKGRDTGLRERVDWEPQNRKAPHRCKVTLSCLFDEGEVVFERIPGRRRGSSGLEIRFLDETSLKGEKAEEWVGNRLGSFSNFMATVYQHQENIRHLAIAQPKDQREAISRLLGLSDYNDLAESIRKSDLMKAMDSIEEEIEKWEQIAYEKISALVEHSKEIGGKISVDPDTIFPETVKEAAANVLDLAKKLAGKKRGSWEFPVVPESPNAFGEFANKVVKCARDCFASLPSTVRLIELNGEITKVEGAIEKLTVAAEGVRVENEKLKEFEREHGNSKDISEGLSKLSTKRKGLEEKLSELSQLTAGLNSLLTYMIEQRQGVGRGACPACGSTTNDQQAYLQQKVKTLLSEEAKSIQGELNNTRTLEKTAEDTLRQIEQKEKDLKTARNTKSRVEKEVGNALVFTWKENEDPLQILKKRSDSATSEAEQLRRDSEKATESLQHIEDECDRLKDLATTPSAERTWA
jgi:DNA repair exonuclease SbcCD ATPase subunit